MKKSLLLLVVTLLAFSCSHNSDQLPVPEGLEGAIDSSARLDEHEDRDEYQHPKETLEFFGVKPNITVVQVAPGSGYYAEILAPYLAKEGQYVMAVPRMPQRPPVFMIENERKLQDILLRHKEVQAKSKFIPFEPLSKKQMSKSSFADMVLAFNTVHTWIAKKSASEAFKIVYDLLKPGGVLGIVQHRIDEKKKKVPKSGYMTEREVIELARKAGFKLVARSEINANSKDTADYPFGVWVLPPTYRLGDKERDKYEAIGESDRMTLKFVKQ